MARGDFYVFNEFWTELGAKVHDLTADTIKGVIITNAITPAKADATPRYSDYSSAEVTGTNYSAGGITFSGTTFTQTAGVYTFDSDNETIAYSAAGFANGYWLVLINDTATNKNAIGYLDLGGPVGNTAEDLIIAVPTTGWFKGQRVV